MKSIVSLQGVGVGVGVYGQKRQKERVSGSVQGRKGLKNVYCILMVVTLGFSYYFFCYDFSIF